MVNENVGPLHAADDEVELLVPVHIDDTELVTNTGVGGGDVVNLSGNPLSMTSCCTHLPTLIGRGATVDVGTACDAYVCL